MTIRFQTSICCLVLAQLMLCSGTFAAEPTFPRLWVYTDMSDPTLPGTNHRGTVNDPDDVSAMAGYLLMANRFETLSIVVASTRRTEHAISPDQATWANQLVGKAYRTDLPQLKQSFDGYPAAGSGTLLHYFIDIRSWDEYFPKAESENSFPDTYYPKHGLVSLVRGGPW